MNNVTVSGDPSVPQEHKGDRQPQFVMHYCQQVPAYHRLHGIFVTAHAKIDVFFLFFFLHISVGTELMEQREEKNKVFWLFCCLVYPDGKKNWPSLRFPLSYS